MTLRHRLLFLLLLLLFVSFEIVACSGSPLGADPRCEALCQRGTYRGAFVGKVVCSQESKSLCFRLCDTQIKNQETICASCLLEGASFIFPSSILEDGVAKGDEFTCTTSFRKTTDCVALCLVKKDS